MDVSLCQLQIVGAYVSRLRLQSLSNRFLQSIGNPGPLVPDVVCISPPSI